MLWFQKLNRLSGAARRLHQQREINDLKEEARRLEHLRECWERADTIELTIGPPGYPSKQLRVISHRRADDAHQVSAPLDALLKQNQQMLTILTQPSLTTV